MPTTDTIRRIPPIETWELRQNILRPHQRLEEMDYAGDNDPDTAHFGIFVRDQLVGIASVYHVPPKGREGDTLAWQLRGMATLPWVRGTGRGKTLLGECIRHCAENGGRVMWCNARLSAVGFYEANGFGVVSMPFEIPGIGSHVVMMRALSEADCQP